MKIIAHLSDMHFGRTDPEIVSGLLYDLTAHPPDVVAISGDLVQRAKRRYFLAARDFLNRLHVPYLVVPGNHDIPVYDIFSRFTNPFAQYQRYITHDFSPLHRDAELLMLGVNTARALSCNFTRGRIHPAQLVRICDVFSSLPALPPSAPIFRVLVAHHPFLPPPDCPDTPLVGRVRQVLPALEACGIDLLLAGHLHRAYNGLLRDRHAAGGRSILVSHAATATSTRLRNNEVNSYTRITIALPQVSLEVRRWNGVVFVPATRDHFVRTPGGWEKIEVLQALTGHRSE